MNYYALWVQWKQNTNKEGLVAAINFWDSSKGCQFDAMQVVDSCLIYVAFRRKQQIVALPAQKMGVDFEQT